MNESDGPIKVRSNGGRVASRSTHFQLACLVLLGLACKSPSSRLLFSPGIATTLSSEKALIEKSCRQHVLINFMAISEGRSPGLGAFGDPDLPFSVAERDDLRTYYFTVVDTVRSFLRNTGREYQACAEYFRRENVIPEDRGSITFAIAVDGPNVSATSDAIEADSLIFTQTFRYTGVAQGQALKWGSAGPECWTLGEDGALDGPKAQVDVTFTESQKPETVTCSQLVYRTDILSIVNSGTEILAPVAQRTLFKDFPSLIEKNLGVRFSQYINVMKGHGFLLSTSPSFLDKPSLSPTVESSSSIPLGSMVLLDRHPERPGDWLAFYLSKSSAVSAATSSGGNQGREDQGREDQGREDQGREDQGIGDQQNEMEGLWSLHVAKNADSMRGFFAQRPAAAKGRYNLLTLGQGLALYEDSALERGAQAPSADISDFVRKSFVRPYFPVSSPEMPSLLIFDSCHVDLGASRIGRKISLPFETSWDGKTNLSLPVISTRSPLRKTALGYGTLHGLELSVLAQRLARPKDAPELYDQLLLEFDRTEVGQRNSFHSFSYTCSSDGSCLKEDSKAKVAAKSFGEALEHAIAAGSSGFHQEYKDLSKATIETVKRELANPLAKRDQNDQGVLLSIAQVKLRTLGQIIEKTLRNHSDIERRKAVSELARELSTKVADPGITDLFVKISPIDRLIGDRFRSLSATGENMSDYLRLAPTFWPWVTRLALFARGSEWKGSAWGTGILEIDKRIAKGLEDVNVSLVRASNLAIKSSLGGFLARMESNVFPEARTKCAAVMCVARSGAGPTFTYLYHPQGYKDFCYRLIRGCESLGKPDDPDAYPIFCDLGADTTKACSEIQPEARWSFDGTAFKLEP